jgi:hypothetical protein
MSFLSSFLTVYSSREHVGCQKGNKQMWEIYQVHSELLQTIYVRTAEQAEAVRAGRQAARAVVGQSGSQAARQPGC